MGTLTYSTQEVQAKLDSIVQIDAKFGTYPRPNLLVNAYFVGGGSQQGGGQFPINTSGITSGSYTQFNQKMFDKWVVRGSISASNPLTISLDADGLGWSSPVGIDFAQYSENPQQYAGKTLTVSLAYSLTSGSGSVGLYGGGSPYYTESLTVGNEMHVTSRTATLGSTVSELRVYFAVNGSAKIYAIKLELGDTQTLAHQKNGVWVLNEIPNYQQELEKCQRYQLELVPPGNSAIGCVGGGTPTSTTQCYVFVPTPTELRTVPTLTYAGTWKLVREGTAPASGSAVSAMSVVNRSANGVTLQITSSGLSTSYRYDLWYTAADTTNKLLLNANL